MKAQKRGKDSPHLSLLRRVLRSLKIKRKIRRFKASAKKAFLFARKTFIFSIKNTALSKILLSQFLLAALLTSTVFGEDIQKPAEDKNNRTTKQTVGSEVFPFEIQKPLESSYFSQDFTNYHPAVDLAAEYGENVLSIGPGRVESVTYDPYGKGKTVIIDHDSNIKSLYAHLGKIDVVAGQEIYESTIIGEVGLTGNTTGSHLHLEIYENGEMVDPKNLVPNDQFLVKI